MTKRYFKFHYPFILLLFSFLSCETIVDVELPKHDPIIVVNSICNPDKPWEFNISLTKGVLDEGNIEIIPKAKIEILENGTLVSKFNHYSNGTYKSTGAKPKVNLNYKLRISVDGLKTVTSNCIIPEPIKIENVVVDTIDTAFEDEKELELTISFTDKPNIENFYSLSIIRSVENNKESVYPIWFESNDLLIKEDDGLFENDRRSFSGEEALFDDTILEGKNYKLKVFVHLYNNYDNINYEIILSSLTKDYYQYLETSRTQRINDDNPFAEPTIVYNNIENGLGIFSGYSSSKYKLF